MRRPGGFRKARARAAQRRLRKKDLAWTEPQAIHQGSNGKASCVAPGANTASPPADETMISVSSFEGTRQRKKCPERPGRGGSPQSPKRPPQDNRRRSLK